MVNLTAPLKSPKKATGTRIFFEQALRISEWVWHIWWVNDILFWRIYVLNLSKNAHFVFKPQYVKSFECVSWAGLIPLQDPRTPMYSHHQASLQKWILLLRRIWFLHNSKFLSNLCFIEELEKSTKRFRASRENMLHAIHFVLQELLKNANNTQKYCRTILWCSETWMESICEMICLHGSQRWGLCEMIVSLPSLSFIRSFADKQKIL